jgi:hypothetical protein
VVPSLQPYVINHYTFDNPEGGDIGSPVELDLGSDATNIELVNGAPRVADTPWFGSQYSLETGQRNTDDNDDWKAGVFFQSSDESTLAGSNQVTAITIMGWFKPLGDVDNNPSPNTNTENPFDTFNAFGLAGLLRGDDDTDGTDGHSVRALLEVVGGRVVGLGRRLDDQNGSGRRSSAAEWFDVMPPGQWTHLAATFDFDQGEIELYKNGAPLESDDAETSSWEVSEETDFTSPTNAGGIKIGGSHPNNSEEQNPFNGRIDELMFFNKWLTPAEVQAQFALVSTIPGDYNGDGMVSAADYIVWRNSDGQVGENLPADGSGRGGVPDGQVDGFDYHFWKEHFGDMQNAPLAEGLSTSVPEPASVLMLLAAFGGAAFAGRCRRLS